MPGNDYNIALCLFFVTYPVELYDFTDELAIFSLKFLQTLLSEKYVQPFTSQPSCLVGELYFLAQCLVDNFRS